MRIMANREATGKPRIEDILKAELDKATGANWVRDHHPSPLREWSLDLSLPQYLIGVEIDGAEHGTFRQRTADNEKTNYLISAGWKILRYPAGKVCAKNRRAAIVEQIHRILCGVFDPQLDSSVLTGVLQ